MEHCKHQITFFFNSQWEMVFAMFHFQVHLECVVYDSIYTSFFEN